jgi:chromosome segregation ATPase
MNELDQQIARITSLGGLQSQGELIRLLQAKQSEINGLTHLTEATKANLATLESRVNELDAYLNENWEDLEGYNEDIANIFKLETEQETEVNFQINGTATIKHPRGTNLEDMDMSELIDVDIVTRDYTYEVQDYDISDISGN